MKALANAGDILKQIKCCKGSDESSAEGAHADQALHEAHADPALQNLVQIRRRKSIKPMYLDWA